MSGLAIAHVLDRGRTAAAHAPVAAADNAPGDGEGFETVVLQRRGLRPLLITARLLAEVAARADELPVWSEIAVYEVGGAEGATTPFAAKIVHRLRLLGPHDLAFAELLPDAEGVLHFIRGHDPVAAIPAVAFIGEAGVWDGAAGLAGNETALAQAILRQRAAWRQLVAAMVGRER
jgi:hypothetical protein